MPKVATISQQHELDVGSRQGLFNGLPYRQPTRIVLPPKQQHPLFELSNERGQIESLYGRPGQLSDLLVG
jgi:hypothetical protein